MSFSETPRVVSFNPFSLITSIANEFQQVPTSDPQLYRDDPENPPESYDADVESPDSFTQSQPFPKRQRMRHKSEASPRRATQSDSAMAQPAPADGDGRRRHSSTTSEKRIIRHTHESEISSFSNQNADVCAQIQILCAVTSMIVELMLIIHFSLPNHNIGLGFVAGLMYLAAGALGMSSAHSKQYRYVILCMIMSVLSVIMAVGVGVAALNGLLALNQTAVADAEPPPHMFDEDLLPPDYDVGLRPSDDYGPEDHMDYDDDIGGHDPYSDGAALPVDTSDVTINYILYAIIIVCSGVEVFVATFQAVICSSTTCCQKYCIRRRHRASTVIYNKTCPERKETADLVRKDVLERGDSSDLQCDSSYHSDADDDDAECNEIFVIPGVHLNNDATEDNHRAMEEFEVDGKNGKKKKKRKGVI